MAVKDKKYILDIVKKHIGEDTSDESIAILEDVTDTLNNMEKTATDDWKSKYEENDKQWREKYMARFYDSESEKQAEIQEKENKPVKREFADLFTSKGGNE